MVFGKTNHCAPHVHAICATQCTHTFHSEPKFNLAHPTPPPTTHQFRFQISQPWLNPNHIVRRLNLDKLWSLLWEKQKQILNHVKAVSTLISRIKMPYSFNSFQLETCKLISNEYSVKYIYHVLANNNSVYSMSCQFWVELNLLLVWLELVKMQSEWANRLWFPF